jgi:hypothetical protein
MLSPSTDGAHDQAAIFADDHHDRAGIAGARHPAGHDRLPMTTLVASRIADDASLPQNTQDGHRGEDAVVALRHPLEGVPGKGDPGCILRPFADHPRRFVSPQPVPA